MFDQLRVPSISELNTHLFIGARYGAVSKWSNANMIPKTTFWGHLVQKKPKIEFHSNSSLQKQLNALISPGWFNFTEMLFDLLACIGLLGLSRGVG